MLKIFRQRTQKDKYVKKEFSESFFIPYRYHWNRSTIMTEDESLVQVVKLGGFSFETADDEDVDIRKNIRNLLFKGIGAGRVSLYFHLVRRRKSTFQVDDGHNMPPGFATYLEDQWREKHINHQSFINEIYITIVRKSSRSGVAAFESMFEKLQQTADKSLWAKTMFEGYEELDEMTSRLVSTFRDYKPKVLGVVERRGVVYSEILEFLGTLVNCGQSRPILVPSTDISRYLPVDRLYFGSRAIEVKTPKGSKFAGIVSIKEYPSRTSATMMDGFLQMPFELIVSQSYSFSDRTGAINSMKLQQGRMVNSGDVAISQIEEISHALDDAMSGRIGFGLHHLTVLCIEDNPKTLENALAMAATELGNAGAIPVRERVNLEPAYWAQLPCNDSFAVRKTTINTLNLSSLASLHNFPSGQEHDNHWGDHVTTLDTTSGTPFFFNFHVRDVGHTTIIGPTGAGKTVMMNFLCAQARKFKCRMFFFDKDRGAEIFIRALGGVYTDIDPSAPCGFNPFALEDTGENRTFLTEFMKSLVCTNGESISADDSAKIEEAIVGNYKLNPKDRMLRNIVPFLGMGGPDSLSGRIAMWHGHGSHASVFDNEKDNINFSKDLIFAFEMAELLKDKPSLGPVLLYVFHKINLSLDGTPSMIVLDEAWALIDNEVFAPKIKDWLKVLRKLNCFVIFATQSVEDASKSRISDTLIQQTATQIFLPNLKATDVYRSHFMLSQREFTLIKTTDPGSRFFLVKQGTDAVVARIDLSGMDNVINVLSGRAETVILLDEIRKEVGDNPDDWLPVFWERVKHV
ncbi:MAG: type IV secretion system protein VirB4 [Alphaproteobacteria bacterium CG11_big_fil_rev_8_21_14_0_20_39_49]|nr:MAG: type IV secretion system protein VirB4 [Alphaproteobacteria bacterium CG11_big_fil_rev_8_21_14_0_20_39_49]